MPTATSARVASSDGDEFDAHFALPDSGSGPGLLLIHEALGVNDYVRGVAARLASHGYVVLAPDVYWRLERNVDLANTEAGLAHAMELMFRLDPDVTVEDLERALAHLRSLPAVNGRVGVIGFCMGGAYTYGVACASDPDCAVSYYGAGIDDRLDRLPNLTCPALFHFGTDDFVIPRAALDRLAAAFAEKPNVELIMHEGAGHAFDNPDAPWYDAETAARAWERTKGFLAEHLGAG